MSRQWRHLQRRPSTRFDCSRRLASRTPGRAGPAAMLAPPPKPCADWPPVARGRFSRLKTGQSEESLHQPRSGCAQAADADQLFRLRRHRRGIFWTKNGFTTFCLPDNFSVINSLIRLCVSCYYLCEMLAGCWRPCWLLLTTAPCPWHRATNKNFSAENQDRWAYFPTKNLLMCLCVCVCVLTFKARFAENSSSR